MMCNLELRTKEGRAQLGEDVPMLSIPSESANHHAGSDTESAYAA